MFFVLSLILPALASISVLILTIMNNFEIWQIILFPILSWLLIFIIICISILLSLHFLGIKYAKTDDPFDKKRWRFMNDVSRFSCFWLGLRRKVVGLDKIKTNNTIVFYSNHVHFTDIILYDLVFIKYPRASMYKEEHNTNPIFGKMVQALGGVAVDRKNDRSALMSVLKIIDKVKKGVNFMIYPEGTRSKDFMVGPYHPGSFKIPEKTHATIVAVAIDYGKHVPCFLPFVRTNVYVEIVDVKEYEEYKDYNTQQLAEMFHDETQEAINKARMKYKYLEVKKK